MHAMPRGRQHRCRWSICASAAASRLSKVISSTKCHIVDDIAQISRYRRRYRFWSLKVDMCRRDAISSTISTLSDIVDEIDSGGKEKKNRYFSISSTKSKILRNPPKKKNLKFSKRYRQRYAISYADISWERYRRYEMRYRNAIMAECYFGVK